MLLFTCGYDLAATKEAIEKAEEQERLKRENEEERIKDAEKQAKEQETLQSIESSSLDSQHVSKEMPESSEQVKETPFSYYLTPCRNNNTLDISSFLFTSLFVLNGCSILVHIGFIYCAYDQLMWS